MREAKSAAVEVCNLAGHCKTYTRTVGLGGEEWCEDVIHNLLADRSAVIAYRDNDMLICIYAAFDVYVAISIVL